MSPISLVIHSIISSMCTLTQRQNTRDKIRNIDLEGNPHAHLYKLLTFPNKNIKYQNGLGYPGGGPRLLSTLRANHQYWSFHFEIGILRNGWMDTRQPCTK